MGLKTAALIYLKATQLSILLSNSSRFHPNSFDYQCFLLPLQENGRKGCLLSLNDFSSFQAVSSACRNSL